MWSCFFELLVVPLGGQSWQLWAQILFYSILGPTVTFATLDWIALEVRRREQAQDSLKRLYDELQASHALLGALQKVTEQFASAADLETAISAASEGITKVTGAVGTAVLLQSGGASISHSYGLPQTLSRHAATRDEALKASKNLSDQVESEGATYHLLTTPLVWAGKLVGSIHTYYARPPESDQRESFSILSSEFSAAAEVARGRTRDLVTLLDVDRSIRAEGNLERLLDKLLSQMMTRADATLGGVYLADEERRLQLRVCRGASCHPGGPPLRLGEGFVGAAAERAEACVANQLSAAERGSGGSLLHTAQSAVALPLLSEQELLGVVVLAHETPHYFDEATLPFLNLVAGQVGLAVRNAQAYLQSEELAIAEERARIAREIHDGVAQSLAFSALKLDLVTRLLKTDPAKAETELGTTKGTLRELIKELRRSIFALRPIDLEHRGFTETVRGYCQDYGQQNGLGVELTLAETPQLSAKSEAVLFRIFQEAMHNVAKHAAATGVKVSTGTTPDGQGFVAVEDDGPRLRPGNRVRPGHECGRFGPEANERARRQPGRHLRAVDTLRAGYKGLRILAGVKPGGDLLIGTPASGFTNSPDCLEAFPAERLRICSPSGVPERRAVELARG